MDANTQEEGHQQCTMQLPDIRLPTITRRKRQFPAWHRLQGAARAFDLALQIALLLCYSPPLPSRLSRIPVNQGQAEQKKGKIAGRPSEGNPHPWVLPARVSAAGQGRRAALGMSMEHG